MQQPDLSNPFVVITAFFGILGTSLMFLIKILPVALAGGGLIVGIGAIGGAVGLLFKILVGQD